MRAAFWLSSTLLVYTQAGYGALLALLVRRRGPAASVPAQADPPRVAVVVAAYREEPVVAAKVANALALDWPRDRLEVVVAVDGGADPDADATADRAREAGADRVLRLPRGGKMRAQDAAVAATDAEVVAFSDANAMWAHDALRRLLAPFAEPDVAYACGAVTFTTSAGATNQEGLYWRWELAMRGWESRLGGITAGNGAIYAVRRDDYAVPETPLGHDLWLPAMLARRGRRSVFVSDARATEPMVGSVEGEWARKRRMMLNAWPVILHGGLLDPRGFAPGYLLMLVSHRWLRYASPLLHLVALVTSVRLARRPVYAAAALAQLAVLAGALAGARVKARPLLVARYYVLMTAAIAAGLVEHLRHGTPQGWEPVEETR